MGVVGVLLLAHTRNEIDQLRPLLDALRQKANFYISDQFYQIVLEQVNESTTS
jgi:predicted nucleic acid-binding protein